MSVVLLSPITGWVAGLDETPDAAFAGGALGDGVAIDPTEGLVRAPCDGEVITVAATGHAVALRGKDGAEVLIHVGVDSVRLKGEGFHVSVAVGQGVRAGDVLLTFDLDAVARGARSLVSPVLVTNSDRFEIVRRSQGRIRSGEVLLELRERSVADGAAAAAAGPRALSDTFVTGLPDGLHARPAARIVTAARASGLEITVGAHGRTASALSVLGLMGLGVRRGDEVTLWADSPQAQVAFAALREAFSASDAPPAPEPILRLGAGAVLAGTKGSPGVAVGTAFRHEDAEIGLPTHSGGANVETRSLQAAVGAVRERLNSLAEDSSGPPGDILRAHLILLDDPALQDVAASALRNGASAGAAWRSAIRRQVELLASAGDRRLRERRADLLDLEQQVLTQLYGAPVQPVPPAGAIVLADELLPSELAAFAERGVAGLAMAGGGATSHVSIMAAALGLPLLVAVSGLEGVADGASVLLDADAGRLVVGPDAATVADMQVRRERRLHRRAMALATAAEPCLTADGRRIAVYANLGGVQDAERAVAEGAEGCGLLRSEFLFQDRTSPPDEDEQQTAYQAVADALHGRPLTIRTLDIGADKPAPYLVLPAEENQALGLRGVRVSLWRPDLLRIQLRAILRVRGEVAILVPMVASRGEIAAVRSLLVEEAVAIGVSPPPLGIMVETPAAALTVGVLCEAADFFSLGTNDLTQYALAMDRTLPMLAAQLDGLHPGVVALMRVAAEAALERGRKLSACGGLAADRHAIPLLIGLGVTELSMPPGEIAEAKALIRSLSATDCRDFAGSLGDFADAAAFRRALAERWPQIGDAS